MGGNKPVATTGLRNSETKKLLWRVCHCTVLSDRPASWSCSHFSPLETYPKDNSLNWQNGHKSLVKKSLGIWCRESPQSPRKNAATGSLVTHRKTHLLI